MVIKEPRASGFGDDKIRFSLDEGEYIMSHLVRLPVIVYTILVATCGHMYSMLSSTLPSELPIPPLHEILLNYSYLLAHENHPETNNAERYTEELMKRIKTLLIKATCMIDDHDCFGRRALHIAIRHELIDLIPALIRCCANPNYIAGDITPPLHLAVRTGSLPTLTSLLTTRSYSHKIDINALDKHEQTALHIAVSCGNLKNTVLLLSLGASINEIDIYSKTPLDYAYEFKKHPIIDLLEKEGGICNNFIKGSQEKPRICKWCMIL